MRRLKTAAKWLSGIAGVLAVAAFATVHLPAFGGRPAGARLARLQASPQFIGGRFENTPPQTGRTSRRFGAGSATSTSRA